MYSELLVVHSWTRWLVLIGIFIGLFITYKGKKNENSISQRDHIWLLILPSICLSQLVLGILLYLESPFVDIFFQNYPESLHQREIRFFGIEHSTIMPISVGLIIFGSIKTYLNRVSINAYKIWFKWILVSFILIILSIPWSFWPLVSRPLFRGF